MTAQAYIYRRYSTDEQGYGAAETLVRQKIACDALIAKHGWTILGEPLTDKGKSAFKGEHLSPTAELGKFVAAVASGEVPKGSVLVAERLDRLSRRPVGEAMAWIHRLTEAGIIIALADTGEVFGAEQDLGSFLQTAIRAGVSHEESRKKSDATNKSKRILWDHAKNRTGKWVNLANKLPSWLKREPSLDGFIVDEKRADVVRMIYQMSADGVGVNTIVGFLNTAKPPVPPFAKATKYKNQPHKWGRSGVRQLLTSPNVEGDFRPATGAHKGQVIPGFYPRIVDADVVSMARADLTARRKVAGKSAASGSNNLFAGITLCGECGRKATLTTSTQKGRSYAYIRCEAAGEKRCSNVGGYAYPKFEATVLDIMLDLALDDRFFAVAGELKTGRVRKAEIEKAVADKRIYRKNLMRSYKENDQDAKDLIEEAAAEIETLEAELVTVEAAIQLAAGRVGNIEHLRRVGDIREAANSDDEATRVQARSKLRLAMSGIVMSVEVERDQDGVKVFTVILKGGIMAVRINDKGKVQQTLNDALGKPLWAHLPLEDQEQLRPLIDRITKMAA